MKNFKTYFNLSTIVTITAAIIIVCAAITLLIATSCNSGAPVAVTDSLESFETVASDVQNFEIFDVSDTSVTNDVEIVETIEQEVSTDPEVLEESLSYPSGPYSLDLFTVVSNMTFYNPWKDEWIELGDYYKSESTKALLLVSSAGWCGPCLMEAAALASIYEKYYSDGLEIIYTLGNTNIPGDVPFDTTHGNLDSAGFTADLNFMENWKLTAATEAGQPINYPMYADPKREFLPYAPNHAWPFSILMTTKDMGVRLVEEGFWSALLENKINLVLYNDVPDIPFD